MTTNKALVAAAGIDGAALMASHVVPAAKSHHGRRHFNNTQRGRYMVCVQCNAKVGYPWLCQSSVDVGFQQSTLPALSALAARGSNKIAATRTRDTTGTGHRLKAFEDLRCQTDRRAVRS